jgi:DNA-binding NtrC family response regulator
MVNPKILVIDDDKSIRKIFRINLEEEGYIIDLAESGEKALRKVEDQRYNLALIDIKLGDMDGIDLLESLQEKAPQMKKIIVTGFPSLQNAIQALNRGADAYILKPVKIDQLLKIIKEQLRKQQEEKEFSEEKMSRFIEDRVNELETIREYYRPI